MAGDTESLISRIRARLDQLPPELQAVRQVATAYLNHRCHMPSDQGEIAIGHSPWNGPASYAFRISPGIQKATLEKYEQLQGVSIPTQWRAILIRVNGLCALGLNLFGASMLNHPELPKGPVIQCLDTSQANTEWKYEYKVDPKYFHIGARDYSDTELVGYFLTNKGTIVGMLQNGRRTGEWAEMGAFLTEELKSAEGLFLESAPPEWRRQP